ncbi:MAG: alpha/beta hydrolase, partial [Xanthomonadaceae bacterium]|nr:alpha/beta hydrolase [Xanthomonadaceae bacterium]
MQPLRKFAATLLAVYLLFVVFDASAATFAQGFVTVSDGVRIHYVDGGLRNGPALLFIPGWTMDAGVWRDQMQRFAQDYRVIAIDPRSQGESS